MTRTDQYQAKRAIQAYRAAGLPVVDPRDCTCGLPGRLVVLARPDGLRVVWPYDRRCPLHGTGDREGPQPAERVRGDRSRSQTATEERRQLAADTDELVRQFVDSLIAAG